MTPRKFESYSWRSIFDNFSKSGIAACRSSRSRLQLQHQSVPAFPRSTTKHHSSLLTSHIGCDGYCWILNAVARFGGEVIIWWLDACGQYLLQPYRSWHCYLICNPQGHGHFGWWIILTPKLITENVFLRPRSVPFDENMWLILMFPLQRQNQKWLSSRWASTLTACTTSKLPFT